MGTHEGVGLFRRIPFLHRILDPWPELFLHPIAGDQDFDAGEPQVSFLDVGGRVATLQCADRVEAEVRQEPGAGDEDLGLPTPLIWHGATINGRRYAADVSVLKTLHVFGAIFLLGGVTTHVLLRPMAARATELAQQALYQFAWRVQLAMVYVGSALVLITGVLLWVGQFKLFTGWLVLGALLFIAAMGLDGALLAPNLRRARSAAGEASSAMAGAALTVQLVAWLLLVVVLFLMVTRPF